MIAPEEGRDSGPDRIELMVAGLVEAFGDRAESVARRQYEMAADGEKQAWQQIIDHLGSAGRPETL